MQVNGRDVPTILLSRE